MKQNKIKQKEKKGKEKKNGLMPGPTLRDCDLICLSSSFVMKSVHKF